jgi:lysophospholipase L1-like esterase
MNIRSFRLTVSMAIVLAGSGGLSGCNDSGGGGLTNKNPGNNDLNVVVAFGDSITRGSECSCAPYPSRLSGMIGKIVYNTGVPGSRASLDVGRTQNAINKYRPAFMLILYGINDIIMSDGIGAASGAINQMVAICKQNNVVPVVATYPIPIGDHAAFAFGTLALNENIRAIASAEGIKCVDLELEFNGDLTLYESDGLHPNDAGTQIMAMAFADLF